jgi:hypothetical protein
MKHTKKELIGVSDHIFYELLMFVKMAQEMTSGKYPQGTTINNALIEAFTIHARILLDFLYGEKKRPDDAVAGDFFPTQNDWFKIRPSMPSNLNSMNKRVGKEIAHLTYSRLKVTPDTKPWHFVDITKDMLKIFNKFLENVHRELLHNSWDQFYSIDSK